MKNTYIFEGFQFDTSSQFDYLVLHWICGGPVSLPGLTIATSRVAEPTAPDQISSFTEIVASVSNITMVTSGVIELTVPYAIISTSITSIIPLDEDVDSVLD